MLTDRSPPAQADQPGLAIDPDLYLGPEDDVIDVDEMPDFADAECDAPAPPEESMLCEFIDFRWLSILDVSLKLMKHLPNLIQTSRTSLTKIYIRWSGTSAHSGHTNTQDVSIWHRSFIFVLSYLQVQSIQDRLGDYKHRHGNLPDPSIPQLLEAERPFRTAWADTSDKLRRADEDLRRMQRAERMTVEMLKVVDSLIDEFED